MPPPPTSSCALVLPAIGQELSLVDMPLRAPGRDEVLIAVRAAGICHSDEHYRTGHSPVAHWPLILGHEIAGVIVAVGNGVPEERLGQRVCVHYVLSCGDCASCRRGREQFCDAYGMIGLTHDGGFAEHIVVPAVNAIRLPEAVSFAQGAILMCAGATAFHAISRSRFSSGETVAVVGVGGVGMLALQIAFALGARSVIALDTDETKLHLAAQLGAWPVDARNANAAAEVRSATAGEGVDVALDCTGLPSTTRLAIDVLGVHGRAVAIGLAGEPVQVHTYTDFLARETELLGSNDHLVAELPLLLDLAARGLLPLDVLALRTVPLEARAVNSVLAELRAYHAPVRTVITP
ncbi:MAG: zinc-binding dehydrogenase [Gemmatimonadaceae bacterium]|nr:zinc-binding dehydrogenase [Gemmatimonadaceae bacterium]